MAFRITATGKIVPALGKPDGAELLSIGQAAQFCGRAEGDLEEEWEAVYGPLLRRPESVIATGTAETLLPTGDIRQVAYAAFCRQAYPDVPERFREQHIGFCVANGLDPRSRQITLKYTPPNPETGEGEEIVHLVLIAGLRAIAHRTGEHGGLDEPVHHTDPDGRLLAITQTAYRGWGENRRAFTAKVMWSDHYRWAGRAPLPDDTWKGIALVEGQKHPPAVPGPLAMQMPYVCLGVCAEAAALRKAFPECANVYTPEEMAGPRSGGGAGAGGRRAPAPRPVAVEQISRQQFELRLIDAGMGDRKKREELMLRLARELAHMADDLRWGKAWATVAANPQAYGLTL